MMRQIAAVLLCILAFPALVQAQATGSSLLGWDQQASALSTAQAYTYRIYVDNNAAQTVVATCTGGVSPFNCTTPLPPLTQGTHRVQLTAANSAGESLLSSPLGFEFVVPPVSPSNLRLINALRAVVGAPWRAMRRHRIREFTK